MRAHSFSFPNLALIRLFFSQNRALVGQKFAPPPARDGSLRWEHGGWEGQATFTSVAAVVVRSHRAHHSVRHIVQEVFEKRVILDYLISEHPDIG